MVEACLAPDALAARGIFDPGAVAGVVRGYMAGHHDNVHLVYGLLHFQLWQDAVAAARRVPIVG